MPYASLRDFMARLEQAGRLVRVLEDYEAGALAVYAVYTNRRFLPARVRTLLDFLVEHFRGTPSWEPPPRAARTPPKRRRATSRRPEKT